VIFEKFSINELKNVLDMRGKKEGEMYKRATLLSSWLDIQQKSETKSLIHEIIKHHCSNNFYLN